MHCCGVQFEHHHWVAHPEEGWLVMRSTGVKITLYLPGFNGLLEVCVKVSPAFNIRPVDATLLEGFHRAKYLLCPEFVQLRITLLNLSQHRVHPSEQGMVLWKRPPKC
jgi:hypothetical protein